MTFLPGYVPTEHEEQAGLINLCEMHEGKWPDLRLIYATPNAAKRTKAERGWLLAEGMKTGVPDLTLPVARRGYHGFYVELKRSDGKLADVSDSQRWWIAELRAQGFFALWTPGSELAWRALRWYLEGPRTIITGGIDTYDKMS